MKTQQILNLITKTQRSSLSENPDISLNKPDPFFRDGPPYDPLFTILHYPPLHIVIIPEFKSMSLNADILRYILISKGFSLTSYNLICDLQTIHDNEPPTSWISEWEQLSTIYSLKFATKPTSSNQQLLPSPNQQITDRYFQFSQQWGLPTEMIREYK